MFLKAPGFLVFLLSLILALGALLARLSIIGAAVPLVASGTTQFYGLLAAYVILLLGCIMRGL